MNNYRFKTISKNKEIMDIQKQVSDNFSTIEEVNTKQKKVTDIKRHAPGLSGLKDGEKQIYFDGTNYWKYERYGGKLFKTQITGV